MTRWTLAGCMALGALSAVAGLDVGASTAEAAPNVSPYAGSWSGTWNIAAISDHSGTFDWTISDEGRITGRVNGAGTIVGHVDADGKLMFVGFVPSDVPSTGGNGYPFQGTASIDSDGKLVVSAFHMAWEGEVHLLLASLERN